MLFKNPILSGLVGCIAACLALAAPQALYAQTGVSSRMAELLAMMPEDTVQPENGLLEIEFADGEAAQPALALGALMGAHNVDPVRAAGAFSLPADIASLIYSEDGADIEAATGLTHSDLLQSLSLRAAPAQTLLLRLAEGAPDRVGEALAMRGLERRIVAGVPVFWSNEEDFGIDLTQANHSNLFGGALGRAERVAIGHEVVLYSPAWPELVRALDQGSVWSEHPGIVAMLAGLDQAIEAPARLQRCNIMVQTSLRREATDLVTHLRLSDPNLLELVAVADWTNGTTQGGVMVLVLRPGGDAEALAARISRNWTEAESPMTGGSYSDGVDNAPVIEAMPGEFPVVTLRLSEGWGADGPIYNPAAGRLMAILSFGALGPLVE